MKQLRGIAIAVLLAVCAVFSFCSLAVAAPVEDPTVRAASVVQLDSTIALGMYPTTALSDVKNLNENVDYISISRNSTTSDFALRPITWKVIATSSSSSFLKDDQVLLLAENTLDYSSASVGSSDLRQWLNGVGNQKNLSVAGIDFLNDILFEASDYKAIIPQTSILGSAQPATEGSSRVFLLSDDQLATLGVDTGQAADTAYASWAKDELDGAQSTGIRPAVVVDLSKLKVSSGAASSSSPSSTSVLALRGSDSPHTGFSITTAKCDTCHATHDAAGDGEALLPTKASAACTYCHVDTTAAHSELQVYDRDVANYTNPPASGKSAHYMQQSGSVTTGTTCADCHVAHGYTAKNVAVNQYLASKLLRGPQSGDAGASEFAANPPTAADSSDVAVSKWCVRCHPVSSHTGHTINAPSSATAFQDANTCQSCHGAGYGTSEWPHYSADSEKFLLSANSASAEPMGALKASEDGVCLRCHRKDATSGVGIDY